MSGQKWKEVFKPQTVNIAGKDCTVNEVSYEPTDEHRAELHKGEEILPVQELTSHVRYEKTVGVGDSYSTETVEGTVDDVLKIIRPSNNSIKDIVINVYPDLKVDEVVETIKRNIEKEIKHG